MAMLIAQLDKFGDLAEYPLAIQSAVNTVRGVLKQSVKTPMLGQDEISIVDSRKAIDNPVQEVQFELLKPPSTKEKPDRKLTLAETIEQANTAIHSPWLK